VRGIEWEIFHEKYIRRKMRFQYRGFSRDLILKTFVELPTGFGNGKCTMPPKEPGGKMEE